MVTVALVTGEDNGRLDPSFVATADGNLAVELRSRGADVVQPSWRDASVNWSDIDVAVVRTAWDYPDHRDAFVSWAESTAQSTTLCNSADVLRWNTHKSYLLELEERGAPVVPTAWLAAGDTIDIRDLLASRSWARAVAKPAVGAGSSGLLRLSRDAGLDQQEAFAGMLADHDVLVQPYLADVEHSGELSVVLIDGQITHAVRKIPKAGDFRVQQEFGSTYQPVDLDDDTAALAAWIVESTGHELLYARVDLVEDQSGTLQLIELEATEPDLYLTVVPAAASRFADAIMARTRPVMTRPG